MRVALLTKRLWVHSGVEPLQGLGQCLRFQLELDWTNRHFQEMSDLVKEILSQCGGEEARYLLVLFNVVQVCFLCHAQVEEGLPLILHSISVRLTKKSLLKSVTIRCQMALCMVIHHSYNTDVCRKQWKDVPLLLSCQGVWF